MLLPYLRPGIKPWVLSSSSISSRDSHLSSPIHNAYEPKCMGLVTVENIVFQPCLYHLPCGLGKCKFFSTFLLYARYMSLLPSGRVYKNWTNRSLFNWSPASADLLSAPLLLFFCTVEEWGEWAATHLIKTITEINIFVGLKQIKIAPLNGSLWWSSHQNFTKLS